MVEPVRIPLGPERPPRDWGEWTSQGGDAAPGARARRRGLPQGRRDYRRIRQALSSLRCDPWGDILALHQRLVADDAYRPDPPPVLTRQSAEVYNREMARLREAPRPFLTAALDREADVFADRVSAALDELVEPDPPTCPTCGHATGPGIGPCDGCTDWLGAQVERWRAEADPADRLWWRRILPGGKR